VSHAIEFRGVAKQFGRTLAIESVDLVVESGEFVSLLGPSGSGKTTLLRMAAGLDQPSTGAVTVGGLSPSIARLHKKIGLVPQAPALLPWRTVAANARLLLDVNRRRATELSNHRPDVVELLHTVGLGDFLDAYPHELSGGMAQRVALVRAFALGAPVLLMDEPFAALDELTRAEMRYLLLSLWQRTGATVLFVTHAIDEATYLSDRVVVLTPRPGRVFTTMSVDLGRPRMPDMEEQTRFFQLETNLRHAVRDAVNASRTATSDRREPG
jgi:NitT/TauT family transport system ATP-binding protein